MERKRSPPDGASVSKPPQNRGLRIVSPWSSLPLERFFHEENYFCPILVQPLQEEEQTHCEWNQTPGKEQDTNRLSPGTHFPKQRSKQQGTENLGRWFETITGQKLKTSSTFPFSSYFLLISREKEVELEPLGRNCRRTLLTQLTNRF